MNSSNSIRKYRNKSKTTIIEKSLLRVFDITLLFSLTFIGDYNFRGLPLFFVFCLLLFIRRGFKVSKMELIIQSVLVLLFLPIIVRPSLYVSKYYISAIYPALYVSVIPFGLNVFEQIRSDNSRLGILKYILVIMFLTATVITIGSNGLRNSIIFGPNVYYRVLGFFSILYTILFTETFRSSSKKKNIFHFILNSGLLLTVIFSSCFCLIKTNSRGAVFVMALLLIITLKSIFTVKKKWFFQIALLLTFALSMNFVVFESSFFENFNKIKLFTSDVSSSRISNFNFGVEGSSFGAREYFYSLLPKFFAEGNFVFGGGNTYIQEETGNSLFYPHNVYLDIIYNQGIISALIFAAFSFISLFLLTRKNVDINLLYLCIILLPVYIGSQFSGTVYDNYSVISLVAFIPLRHFLQERKLTSRKI